MATSSGRTASLAGDEQLQHRLRKLAISPAAKGAIMDDTRIDWATLLKRVDVYAVISCWREKAFSAILARTSVVARTGSPHGRVMVGVDFSRLLSALAPGFDVAS